MNKVNNNNLPLVTVGITSFERPITLKQTIQSVLNQTYKNLEVFVIDDCSKKNDIKSLISFYMQNDERVRFFSREANVGVTENVNLMIRNAQGKYFLWVCDDDWIAPDYIKNCLEFIQNNPSYSLVTGSSKFCLGEIIAYEPKKINIDYNSSFKRFIAFHDQCLGTANCPNFGLIKTDLLRETPLKNVLGHDNILIGNIALSGKIKTLDGTNIYRRLGGSSETLKKSADVNNYSFYEKTLPFIALYTNIVNDIFSFNSQYKKMSWLNKTYLFSQFTINLIFNIMEKFFLYKKRNVSNVKITNFINNSHFVDNPNQNVKEDYICKVHVESV